jgi:hypothetical protein
MRRAACALFVLAAACEKPATDPLENATPSPNASILPAPLSSAGQPAAETPAVPGASSGRPVDSAGKLASLEAGVVVPLPMRGDQAVDEDPLTQRELTGITLDGEWRLADLPAPPKSPEANVAGLENARKLTAPRMTVDLSSIGRMRVTFESRALPLGEGAEIRSRTDRYGHVLVWPNGTRYRALPPGAVRTVLGERRVDAIPLVRPQSSGKTDGAHRAGLPTKKWELSTRTGKLVLEQAKIIGAGEGGTLFCRFLSEIVAIDPSAAPCSADDVPLRAQFNWPQGGSTVFEVVTVSDRVEFAAERMFVPPSNGEFTMSGLPPESSGIFLSREELTAFRLRPLDVGTVRPAGSPDEGIVLANSTDSLRYAFLDSIPLAWVMPGREQWVIGPPRGRYMVQWRTFLGDAIEPPSAVDLPARVTVGAGQESAREK